MTTTLNTQTTEVHPVGLVARRFCRERFAAGCEGHKRSFPCQECDQSHIADQGPSAPFRHFAGAEPEKFDFFVNGIAATGALYSGHFELLSGSILITPDVSAAWLQSRYTETQSAPSCRPVHDPSCRCRYGTSVGGWTSSLGNWQRISK